MENDGYTRGFGIETRYHGPTNYRGSRISARFTDDQGFGTRFYDYAYALDSLGNHENAARAFLEAWVETYPYRAAGRLVAACGADRGYIFTATTFAAE